MSEIDNIEAQKKILVEKFGMFMERNNNYSPIAARIFGTLLIEKEGATFDHLVSFLGASKSTVSTNLKRLLQEKNIAYYTNPGDRKKYYKVSGFLDARLEKILGLYKAELSLVHEIFNFKYELDGLKDKDRVCAKSELITNYIDYLSNSISLGEQLLTDIKSKCSAS